MPGPSSLLGVEGWICPEGWVCPEGYVQVGMSRGVCPGGYVQGIPTPPDMGPGVPSPPQLLTHSGGGGHYTYGQQAGDMHPTKKIYEWNRKYLGIKSWHKFHYFEFSVSEKMSNGQYIYLNSPWWKDGYLLRNLETFKFWSQTSIAFQMHSLLISLLLMMPKIQIDYINNLTFFMNIFSIH